MIYALISSNILMVLVFLLQYGKLPPQLPLFYSRPWGEDQLADIWMIFLLPVIMNMFYALNHFLYEKYFNPNNFIKKIMWYIDIFLIVSLTGVFLKILFLISS